MWGNLPGWLIALVLLVLLGWGMQTLNRAGDISEPTGFAKDPATLGAVELPISPGTLVPMDTPVDAKSLYRAAISDYKANFESYERFARSKRAADAGTLPGLSNLIAATHAQKASIFADDPGEIVTYGEKPALDALVALGHLASRAALLLQSDNPAEAQKYFEAEFALGAKLCEERLTVEEFSRGLELLAESSAGLTRLFQKSGDTTRAAEFNAFSESRTWFYNDRILPVLKILQSIDANVIGEHAGDIFYLARKSGERMYRVEAIFALGRLKYFAGQDGKTVGAVGAGSKDKGWMIVVWGSDHRLGNQRGAMQELKRLTQNPDPVIRRAATEARDLTIEQYRMLR